jgi:DNA transformation protein
MGLPMATALPPFVAHCQELLEPVGTVRVRRMFSGWGLYARDLFIAIVAFERLYLKTDVDTEAQFAEAGGLRFEYQSAGRYVMLHYWTPPAEALESPALMLPWARLATQAALSSRSSTAAGAARRRRPPAKART